MILIGRRDQTRLCFLKEIFFQCWDDLVEQKEELGEQLSNDKLFVIYCSY
jgi:hypothetical protein